MLQRLHWAPFSDRGVGSLLLVGLVSDDTGAHTARRGADLLG